MSEISMSLSLDNVVLSAQAGLGCTLSQFLILAGYPEPERPLTDGIRVLSPALELAHRWREARLSSSVPCEMLAETPALLVADLLIPAQK
jgi:hypothetical protein